MIYDNKLLAAFTLAAYEARQCGNDLVKGAREKNMRQLSGYIETGRDFPQDVIDTHKRLATEVRTRGIRPYIYEHHVGVIREQDVADPIGFDDMVRTVVGYKAALLCSTNFYKVNSVDDRIVNASNMVSGENRGLKLIAGLEIPQTGNVVSGHWNHFLEIIDQNSSDFKKYIEVSRKFHEELRRMHENQK